MKKLLNYFAPITINQIKRRMAEVQNNCEVYTAIINAPSKVRCHDTKHSTTLTSIKNTLRHD